MDLHTGFVGSRVVQRLVEAGADLNKTDKNGRTVVYMASWNGHADVVKLFIEAGAGLNAVGAWGTALKKAREAGRTRVVKMLEAAGAKE